ncbi:hypothetical protein LOTGIDRAFT_151505 [Lottia gigantea]|uniref:Large ribosomal subunit protein uL29 n=1 Tax=Lottia gigantea TaxID=225164 RepID=V4CFT5_LOTGI|nr:hypothetical protein LOTGIDRAFT_151505 [Lottia gigantea]ESP00890.1 hypothetical protein LOTGIDRAFT_151505 [Lottia gigantea]
MTKIKAKDYRGKKKEELDKKLDELKEELQTLRVATVTGGSANKLSKIRTVRKSVGRVLTVMNQTRKENLRKFYKKKKWVPKQLRRKKTRAIRRSLTDNEKNIKSKKARRKAQNFPMRKFAVKS